MRHDSHILSDWYPEGMSRATAEKLAVAVNHAMQARGLTRDEHDGRRDFYSCDRATVTSPAGWKINHPGGAATIKMRGCDHYRAEARAVAAEILTTGGLRPAGSVPTCHRPERWYDVDKDRCEHPSHDEVGSDLKSETEWCAACIKAMPAQTRTDLGLSSHLTVVQS